MAASVDYSPIYQAAGQEWNVDPSLIAAVAGQEGGGVSNVSSAGAQGHMQIMPDTQRDLGVTDPNNVVQSIYGGAKYLSQLIDHYQGQPDPVSAAVGAYNAGPGRMDDYIAGKGSLPAETVAYIPGVARRYQAIMGSSGQSQPAPAIPGTDDAATSALDTRMAQLRAGGGQPAPAPTSPPPAANSNPTPGPVDYFSQAKAAAQAATGGSGSAAVPTAMPPASTLSQAPAGGQTGVAAPGGPVDYFSMAKAAAQAATAAPAAPDGAVTPVSTPGAAQPSPSPAQTPAGPQAGTGIMGGIENLAEGAGHAALQASHGLYSLLNRAEQMAPGLNGLDRAVGINPPAALANLDAENQQYQNSGVGSTPAGQAGNIVGQTALTLPVLAAPGLTTAVAGAGRAIAAGADAIAPALGSATRATGNFLMGTASTPGNAITNAVVRPASLAVNGALQGGTAGVLTGDPNSTVGQNLLLGAGAGAALGPVAAAVGAAGKGVWNSLLGIWQPLTTGGRAAIADNVLAKAAQGGPLVADTTTHVPGSSPTLAQATANPGLAGVERAVAAVRPNPFTNQATANNEARVTAVENATGTPADIATAQANRDATAVPAITGPIANATAPADASPVVSTIDQILASPAGQRDAVTSALGNIRSKLVTPVPFANRVGTALDAVNQAAASNPGDVGLWGAQQALAAAQNGGAQQASTLARLQGTTTSNPAAQAVIDQAANTIGTAQAVQSDPAQLYGIRKAINDSLSPLAAASGSDARLAASELQQVKTALDNSIEGAAPGFKQGLADYADSSRPIDAMNYLQSKGYTSADGTVTMAKVKSVLDDITKQNALPGPRDAKSVPQSTMDSLQGLYADLLRQNNSRLGMQPGSNTFQNLATAAALQGPAGAVMRGLGALPAVGNLLSNSVGRLYQNQNEPILDAVVNRLLNPDAAAGVVKRAQEIAARSAAGSSGANSLAVVPGTNLLMSAGRN